VTESITAMIWDWGNVLGRFDHIKACQKLALRSAASFDEILKIFYSGDEALAKLHDTGAITPARFFSLAQRLCRLDEQMTFEEFRDIWRSVILGENKKIGDIIGRIRPDILRCILSNTDPIHWTAISQLPAVKKYFSNPDLRIRSYNVGVRKPDLAMYREALECLGLRETEAHRVLYIEDVPEYCEAFRSIGGNALQYDCSKEPIARLEEGLRVFGVFEV